MVGPYYSKSAVHRATLGRITTRKAQEAAYCYVSWPVLAYLRVYLLVTTVSCAKTYEPIEMSFGEWTLVRGDGAVHEAPDPPREKAILDGDMCRPIIKHREYPVLAKVIR